MTKIRKKIKATGAKKGLPGKKKTFAAISLLALGLFLMPTGFVLADVIQGEIDKGIAAEVSVPSKHSSAFDDWVTNDYEGAPEMYETFYLWNLTNPTEYIDGDKPIFEEIGPFVFRRYDYKYDIDFSDDNDEVSYKEYSTYVQVGGDDFSKVNITNVNPGYLGAIGTAGGTVLDFLKLITPLSLQILKETFIEEYLATLPDLMVNDYDTAAGIGILNYTPPGSNKINQSALVGPYGDFRDPSRFNFTNAIPAVTVFYEKWANDYFPYTGHSYNFTAVVDPHGLMVYLDNTTFLSKDCARVHGNELVNEDGSASDIGVDIDGRSPYNFTGTSETDLNISTSRIVYYPYVPGVYAPYFQVNEGGSNITQEQCQDLWDKNNPYSLTGHDYQKTTIWWDALDGDIASRQFLNDTFGLTNAQLDLILDWLNVSIHTWLKNVAGYTQDIEWNSGFIVTRTVEEWLFTANDTAVYNFQKHYNYEEDLQLIGFFDNCHNKGEAEAAGVPEFTINTGRNDVNEVGQVIEFNGQKEINIWAEPIEIEGTLGLQFAPGVSEEDDLKVFNVDLMRVVELEYDEPAEIYDIQLLQYKVSPDAFSPDPLYFQNIEGIVNLATVEKYHNAPVRVSNPHFLGAPLSIQKSVIGMKPNSDIHETYVRVEPLTGFTMDAALRAQVNFEVKPDDFYFPNISNTIMPVAWLEQSGEIPEDLAEEFKGLVYWALDLKEKVPIYCLGLGAMLCIPGAALTTSYVVKRRRLAKKEKVVKLYSRNKKEKLKVDDEEL